MNVRSTLFLVALILSPCLGFAASKKHVPSDSEIANWLADRARGHEGLASRMEQVRDAYRVVFVPGILGSQLRMAGFTYGEDEITADRLVFDPSQRVETGTLNRFKAHVLFFSSKVDIYGSGLDLLAQSIGGKPAFEFSYDWRNDIDVNVDRLQQTLERELKGKKIILLGHSMGGVIGWRWKSRYPRESNPVKLAGLVLLGSPLQGSCEPARMLVEGYGPPDGAGTFEKIATSLVFGDAHPAIFTFPSVFQLLPLYKDAEPCLKVKSGDKEYALDHHEPAVWLGRDGAGYGAGGKFHSATGLSEAEFVARVKAAVDAGRRFRRSFSLAQDGIQTYLLFSTARKLQRHYVIERDSDWFSVLPRPADVDGDGRVPAASAQNLGHMDMSRGGYWPLQREHGELLSDQSFGGFANLTLKRHILRWQHTELLAYALEDPILKKELDVLGWIPDPGSDTLFAGLPEMKSAQQLIARYTVINATGAQTELARAAIREGRRVEPKATLAATPAQSAPAKALYTAAFILDPKAADAGTLNRLGLINIKHEQFGDAVRLLTKASRIFKSTDNEKPLQDLGTKIDVNLRFATRELDKQSRGIADLPARTLSEPDRVQAGN